MSYELLEIGFFTNDHQLNGVPILLWQTGLKKEKKFLIKKEFRGICSTNSEIVATSPGQYRGEGVISRIRSLAFHQGFRRYAANTSWMFAEQILRIIAGLFVSIWVARYLGPEQFGVFSYVLAFTAIFGGIAKLGLDGIVVRDLVNDPNKRDVYLGTAFWLKVIGAVIAFGVIAFATLFTSNDATTNFYIFIIAGGMMFQSFEVINFYFQSRVLSKFVSLCKMTQLLLSSLLKIYFVLTGAGLFWFVLVSLFDQLTLAVSLGIAYRIQMVGSFYRCFDMTVAKRLLRDSWPLIITIFATMLLFRVDQLMVKEMIGVEAVGYYAAAVRLTEVFYFIPTIITTSLFPAILNAKKNNKGIYNSRLLRLYSLLTWLAIGIILLIIFFGEWLVVTLYGVHYSRSIDSLIILAWASIFIFLGNASKKWFLTENLQRLLLYRIITGVVLNIILNIILIPIFEIQGAALATCISYAFTYYFSYIFNEKLRDLFFVTTKAINPKFIFKG